MEFELVQVNKADQGGQMFGSVPHFEQINESVLVPQPGLACLIMKPSKV